MTLSLDKYIIKLGCHHQDLPDGGFPLEYSKVSPWELPLISQMSFLYFCEEHIKRGRIIHIYVFLKHTTAKLLVYRLTYTSYSYRFWFHLFCFSYSHGLVMLVLCIMFLLLHTSAYSCFLWHSLVYSIVPCCHILK